MPNFHSLVDSAEHEGVHPALKDLRRSLEVYHRQFMALHHVCHDLGARRLHIGGREYETFLAALNNGRFDQPESIHERIAELDPAVQALEQAMTEVRTQCQRVVNLPEHKWKTPHGQYLPYAASRTEVLHEQILATVQVARDRWAFVTDKV